MNFPPALTAVLALLPFAGALLMAVVPPQARRASAALAGAVALAGLALALAAAPAVFAGEVLRWRVDWVPALNLAFGFRMDGLAWLFATLITGIGALIVLYAAYYLHHEDPARRFFLYLLLFMGAMLTQRPDLINAAVIQVPLFDMLRFHRLLAGASWIAEYGNPDIPEERAWIQAYSPYQNLRAGQPYPEVFIHTSTKDDRVHPGHARKAAARLEDLGYPVLFYENTDGGHGAAANLRESARRLALEYTYLSRRLMD